MTDTLGKPARVEWLDAGRAVVLASMVWVNDIAGVAAAPAWMKHYYPYDANGITFVDVVFPAFLFIVGMAIPAAMASRQRRGEGRPEMGFHAVVRTVGLLVAGVVMVNMGSFDAAAAGWWPGVWGLAGYGALACLFVTAPWDKRITLAVRLAGAAALVWLVMVFEGKGGKAFGPQWWGILGLIGWAYLVATVVVMASGGRWLWMVAAAAGLLGLWYVDKWGRVFDGLWLRGVMDIGGALGTHSAIVLLGAAFFVVVQREQERAEEAGRVWRVMGVWAVLLLAATAVLYPLGGLNKNIATPAWATVSAAATVAVLAVVRAAGAVSPKWLWVILSLAGTNVLLGYLMSGTWYQLLQASGWAWYGQLVAGADAGAMWMGILRATVTAGAIVTIVAGLARVGVRLKL
jgi:hypothetical protein